MRDKNFWSALSFLLIVVLLVGCKPAAPTAIPDAPSSPQPTSTSTSTALPTVTPPPPTASFTATLLPATATATPPVTPEATATFLPSATQTPTVAPTPALSNPTASIPLSNSPKNTSPLALPGSEKAKQPVRIFLIQLNTGGKVGCGDSAVPVTTNIPRTKSNSADIESALKLLFNMKNKYYGNLYNPVSYSTLRVQDVEFTENGTLRVWLSGKYRPSGDDCDNTRVKAQIWSTAKQFGAKSTDFYINGPNPFGDFVSNDK